MQVSSSSDSPTFALPTWSAYSNLPECTDLPPGTDCNLNPLANHTAYRYQLVVYDIAGNSSVVTSLSILKIDTTTPRLMDVTNVNPPNYLASVPLYGISVDNAL